MNSRLGIAAAAMFAAALGLGGCIAAGADEIVPAPLADCVGCAAPNVVAGPFYDDAWYGGWLYGYAHVHWPHRAYHGGWHGRVHASRGFHGHHHG